VATGSQDPSRGCAFCGFEGKLSGEHIWPEWVREIILTDMPKTGGYVWAEHKSDEPRRSRYDEAYRLRPGGKLADITVKRVCEDCNTGWMHRIEDAAIPVLTRPIQGDPVTFDGDDLDIVARWAFLKCLVVTLSTHKGSLVSPKLCDWMRRHQRPPRSVLLTMACYGGIRHPLYASAGPVRFYVQVPTGERTERHAYQMTISVGHAVFQTFGHHIANVLDLKPSGRKRDTSCLIWPKPDSPVGWSHQTDSAGAGTGRAAPSAHHG
jgi:hypothetical protein